MSLLCFFLRRKLVPCGVCLSLIFFILLGNSCSKEDYDLENGSYDSLLIKTALAAPIGNVHVTLNDIVRHDGIRGKLVTDDKIFDLVETLELPFPIYCTIGTRVMGFDTITGVDLDQYLGESNIIDSLHVASLNFNVENQFPLSAVIRIVFMEEEKVMGVPFYRDIQSDELSIQLNIPAAKILESPVAPITNVSVEREVKVEGSAQSDLMKATAIRIEYELILEENQYVYLVENQSLKLDLSAYLKADVFLN